MPVNATTCDRAYDERRAVPSRRERGQPPRGAASDQREERGGIVNEIQMSGVLIECEPLRYTPAGVPICQARLDHESTQHEAGHDRQVTLSLAIRFAGSLAERISREPLGSLIHVKGFMAPKRVFRDGTSSAALQMHVAAYHRQ